MQLNNHKDTKEEYINLNNYILQNRVGQGSYSKVYRIKDKGSGEIYAAKVSIEEIDYSSNDQFIDFSREVTIISKFNHPSVLKFIGFSPFDFKKRSRPVIITEYTSNGSLEDLLLSEKYSSSILDDTYKLIIIYGIAAAMSYLHSHNIIHRDLKSANILIDKYLFPKIADFGLSKINHPNFENMAQKSRIGCVKGTSIYMSPEIWQKSEYSKSSDVYAFSIIVYEIVTNKKPFEGVHLFQIPLKLKEGYRPEFDESIPDAYIDLITSCWNEDPSQRPTFESILEKLRTNEGFITKDTNKEKYLKYVNYIDEFNISFDEFKIVNISNIFTEINQNDYKQWNEYFSMESSIYPFKKFMQLDEKCKCFVLEAKNDPQKQFILSQYLIEGQELFERDLETGLTYLNECIKSGLVEAAIYYCRILIKGNLIHRDIEKAKKLLERNIKEKDPEIYYLLHAKIKKKEGMLDESLELFEKSMSFGNIEAIYEYGKLLQYVYADVDDDKSSKGYYYIQKAICDNYPKALLKCGLVLIRSENQKDNLIGAKCIQIAADAGNKDALYNYGRLLNQGNIITRDEEKAFEYMKKAAYKGHTWAMLRYGGELIQKSEITKESVLFVKKASDAGLMEALYFYSIMLNDGIGVPVDHQKASSLIRISANNGCSEAMLDYGLMLLNEEEEEESNETDKEDDYQLIIEDMPNYKSTKKNIKPSKAEAIKYFKMAADKDNEDAMINYALMLIKGEGCEMNKEEGIKYLKDAINKGYSRAINVYASMLLKGEGCEKNEEEGIRYLKMGIDNGYTDSMILYSQFLIEGVVFPMNKEEAIKYCKMAADNGSSEGMEYYADMLRQGEGCEINKEEAIKYYKMAIDKGNANAITKYAEMLENGEGCEINKEEALKYYKIASEKGNTNAMINYVYKSVNDDNSFFDTDEIIKYTKIAADEGDPIAMNMYAMFLRTGEFVKRDPQEAMKYFKMAINKGNIDSMELLAEMFMNGEGCSVNIEEATKYYKMAIDNGNISAMHEYAKMLSTINADESIKYYKMAIDQENTNAMVDYAIILLQGELCPADIDEAMKYLKMAADNGNISAMNYYSIMLRYGRKCTVNLEESIKYLKMAADNGEISSMVDYGNIMNNGEGCPVNEAEAMKYYKMAADKGSASAMYNLAIMLENGEGCPVNEAEAMEYYKMAADKGIASAMNNLALMLKNDEQCPVNEVEAAKYLKKAADKGNSFAMQNYSGVLKEGKGCPVNIEESIKYLKMAIDKGNENAMHDYAHMLYQGDDGVPINKEESMKYLKMAIDKGNTDAILEYARMLHQGDDGVPINKEESMKYLKMAIDKGNANAMLDYARMLFRGDDGVPINREESIKYFKLAAKNGSKKQEIF